MRFKYLWKGRVSLVHRFQFKGRMHRIALETGTKMRRSVNSWTSYMNDLIINFTNILQYCKISFSSIKSLLCTCVRDLCEKEIPTYKKELPLLIIIYVYDVDCVTYLEACSIDFFPLSFSSAWFFFVTRSSPIQKFTCWKEKVKHFVSDSCTRLTCLLKTEEN